MKLWDKGTDGGAESRILQFTVGQDRELDLALAKWDVLGTLAHIGMLQHIDLLTSEEYQQLRQALIDIHAQIEAGSFHIQEEVEDIHSEVEFRLTQQLGDIGKKVHSGRSRNDQVLLDLKLFFLSEIRALCTEIQGLFNTLQALSEQHKAVLLPGYTHFQVAMPSSFGLWFGSYAESLVDDMVALYAAWQVADQNPLGSAAGYGSSFPLDRELTTRLLGFSTLSYNVVYAQMGRGKSELFLAFALASIGTTLNKLAADVCLYMSQNFGFIRFPDALTTGSSIMPHKKNPDVFELIRARSNRMMSLPGSISHLLSNLPSGYHRDLQLLKEYLFPCLEETKQCLNMAAFMLEQVQVNPDIVSDPRYDYLFTVEAVNRAVLGGTPFREAYQQIGQQIADGSYQADREVLHTHLGSIGQPANAEIQQKLARVMTQFDFGRFDTAFAQLLSAEGPQLS